MEHSAYQEKMDTFIKKIPDNMHIFEITKSCDHSNFVMVYKNSSLMDLYKSAQKCCQLNENIELYIVGEPRRNSSIKSMTTFIPNTDKVSIQELIDTIQTTQIIKPLYELPAPVVYRIYCK
jgi:hypothetical protein